MKCFLIMSYNMCQNYRALKYIHYDIQSLNLSVESIRKTLGKTLFYVKVEGLMYYLQGHGQT